MEHIKSTNFELVEDFMEATGEETLLEPVFPEERIQRLRIDLIEKELDELTYAIDNVDIVEVANALTELLYVVYGTGHAFGLDLDECLKEVHASNMSTLGPEGPIINEGEVLRPDTYFPPDLKTVLNIN
jgi:predicted HAD superfamily Cof-like phosphohydrolase